MTKSIKKMMAILALLSISTAGLADEVLGKTYPINEPDMLEEIKNKLKGLEKAGELAKLQQEAVRRSKESAERPDPVKGLVKTKTPRTFYYDPSLRVPRDITTPEGQVIAKAGDTVNPLSYMPLSKHLIFFDQNDAAQVKFAATMIKKYNGRVKPILVAGEPLALTRLWKQQVYFDQSGNLVKRFGITQTPALVSQENLKIRIDEMEAPE